MKNKNIKHIRFSTDTLDKIEDDIETFLHETQFHIFNNVKNNEEEFFIDVSGLRNIGKTTALAEYANTHDFIMVSTADPTSYENRFYTMNDIRAKRIPEYDMHKPVIIDEGINRKEVEDLGFKVVGGYYSEN